MSTSRDVPQLPTGARLKRIAALVPLSRDHHDTLVQALQLKRAAASGDAARLDAAVAAFLGYFQEALLGHFSDEEDVLLPAIAVALPEAAARIAAEHAAVRRLAGRLADAVAAGTPLRKHAAELGQLLDDHVRYEERGAFSRAQERLDAEQLAALGAALEEHRQRRGLAPACALPARLSGG